MRRLGTVWRHFFDIRPGEYLRTAFMFLYLLFVLFAYYVLKPVSRAMFLTKLDVDSLPYLIILIAIGGGLLAYLYSKVAVKASLKAAVTWTSGLSVASLLAMWWILQNPPVWMLYGLNIWVGLFSIVMVSQGWLVASNLFDNREAKRIYPLLGMSMVLGAALGGEFTNFAAKRIKTHSANLLLAAAALVILAYFAYRLAAAQKSAALGRVRAAHEEEADFNFRGMVSDIGRNRHLQVIIGIMFMMFIVDVLVDFQFQAMARQFYQGPALTAYLGRFYGLYLNGTEFFLQLFLTSVIVRWFGVGGTLQAVPLAVALTSFGTVGVPGTLSTAGVRLAEASTRYTVNKTGMELLYMPLPRELRNRIKAFIDIFFDRMSRGIGGVILVVLTAVLPIKSNRPLAMREMAVMVIALCVPWVLLTLRARHEYVSTIRRRLASRRLDIASARLTIQDEETIAIVEQTVAGDNPRQAAYALGLLAEAPDYDLSPQLKRAAGSPFAEVRAQALELARQQQYEGLRDEAIEEVSAGDPMVLKPAVAYLLWMLPNRTGFAREWLNNGPAAVGEGVLEALAEQPEICRELATHEWVTRTASDPDPERRALAALALGICGDQGTEALFHLLADEDRRVAAAACRAAARLRNRAYVYPLVRQLSSAAVRRHAIDALASFGPPICGTLGDLLNDPEMPAALRQQIPRVLKAVPDQRSVDVLLAAIGHQDLAVRGSVLKALNRLRETAPHLNFANGFVAEQILAEARYYFELIAALEPFRGQVDQPRSATRLLARTLEERLAATLERLFRLLGLRYPPKEIYSAYLAVSRRRTEEAAAALEFLDNVLERDLKKVLLPMLDAPERALARGHDLFGVEPRDAESAVRELIRSRDPWLMACAMATAGEWKLRNLAPEIAEAVREVEGELYEVARSTQVALA